MDMNLLRGAVLILLIAAFTGLWIWAWSSKRKADFDAAARLPLEEGSAEKRHSADARNGE